MKSIFKKTLCSIMLFCLLFLCVGVVTKVSAETATVTYTVASTTSVTATGTAPTGSTATFKNTYTRDKSQLTEGNTATLTLSGFSGYKISTVVLSMHSNSKKGAGTFSMVVGATTLAAINSNTNFNKWYDNTSFGTGYRDVTVALNEPDYLVQANENIVITIKASINSLYIEKYIITYANSSTAEQVKVTFDSNGGSDVSDQTIEKGTKATRPDVAPTYVGYEFLGWFEKDSDTPFDFDTEINESITLYAKWKATSYLPLLSLETKASLYVEWNTTVTTRPNVKYELVTNAEGLVAGDKLIIANITKGVLANDTINNSVLGATNVSFNGEELPNSTNVEGIFTLGGKSGAWTLANSEGQLLGATAVKKLAWGKGTTTWSISFSGNDATIQNSTSSYGRILYNAGSPRFTTYTSSANENMLLPQIYKVVNDPSSTIEVTNYEVTSLAMRFGMIIKKDLYDAIVADNIKFGVALVKGSKFDESKATFVECEPVRVNADGVEDANGECYQFAAVITDIPEADRTTNVIAKVYVYNSEDKIVLGYAQEKSMSVQTLAAAYGDYEGYEGILAYLKR